MDMYGGYFEYAGIASDTYGLLFANASTPRYTQIIGTTETISVLNKHNVKRYYAGTSYDNAAIEFDAEILVDGVIHPADLRTIEKWLFRQNGYKKLYFNRAPGLYLNCRFANPEKVEGNGGVVGWKFAVECDSPMMLKDASVIQFSGDEVTAAQNTTVTDSSGQTYTKRAAQHHVLLPIDTDATWYVYPKITLKLSGDSLAYNDITIINHTDSSSRITKFANIGKSATIVIDSSLNMISGGNGYYESFTSPFFPRALDGNNDIEVRIESASSESGQKSLNSDAIDYVKFEWQETRWL